MSTDAPAPVPPAPRPPSPSCLSRRRRCSLDPSCLSHPPAVKSEPRMRRRCSFGCVSVREHSQTLGDSPSCQEGAPLALDWQYAERKSVPLDDFENARKDQRRKSRGDLILDAAERRKRLVLSGSTLTDILRAERMVALKNRMASMVKSPTAPKSCSKAPKRTIVSRAA